MDKLQLWFEISQLQERYIATLDNDKLEEWPQLFTEKCLYQIIPKENFDAGFPVSIIYCDTRNMLEDRVTSLRNANIYEVHSYRHMTSGLMIKTIDDKTVEAESSYVVIQTLQDGESRVYQAGRYLDVIALTEDGWRYQSKRVVFDTLRVQTLLATPI